MTAIEGEAVADVAAPLRMRVVQELRSDITSLEYGPGVRLVERDLCSRYGVSRTVIREALRQLETEGLVSVIPNQGPIVAQMTWTEAAEIYEVRRVLEPLVCALFMERAPEAEKQRLLATVDRYEDALERGLPEAWRLPDEYYDILLDGCGNSFLAATFRATQVRVRLARRLSLAQAGRAEQSLAEFRTIAEAIGAGDAGAAIAGTELHVLNASRFILRALQGR